MRIRYRGGPLSRQSFTGSRHQPKYRDPQGRPLGHDEGYQRIKGGDRNVYCYDRCGEYVHLPTLFVDIADHQIAALLEHAQQHPGDAHLAEAQIRRLEQVTT